MATKFWVLGSGNWSDTTHWATSAGGAGSTGVPAIGDIVTVDSNVLGLNGGTLTVDVQPNTLASFTATTMTGTFDNSANFNLTTTGGQNWSGTTTRTITGGTGTYTCTGSNSNGFDLTTTTGLSNPTTAFSSATISLGNGSANTSNSIASGGCAIGTVTIQARTVNQPIAINGAGTVSTLNIAGPNRVSIAASTTVTNIGTIAGSSTGLIYLGGASSTGTVASITLTNSGAASWVAFANITFVTGTVTATNSFDLKGVTGASITGPTVGGAAGVIGS